MDVQVDGPIQDLSDPLQINDNHLADGSLWFVQVWLDKLTVVM